MTFDVRNLPDIPHSWLVAVFFLGMIALRAMNIDSFVSVGLSLVAGFLFGKDLGKTQAFAQVQGQGEAVGKKAPFRPK
jgi:RsiW-degrading membrane proteinase PrsW (M82 family)